MGLPGMELQQAGTPFPVGSRSWFDQSRRGLPGDTSLSNPGLPAKTRELSQAFLFAQIDAFTQV